MEEKISSEALQKNLPAVDEVSDPDSVSESVVTTVSGNDAILVPGAAVAAYSNISIHAPTRGATNFSRHDFISQSKSSGMKLVS